MALTKQDFKAPIAMIAEALTSIAEAVERLSAQAQRKDLTEAEEAEVFVGLGEVAQQARKLRDALAPTSEGGSDEETGGGGVDGETGGDTGPDGEPKPPANPTAKPS
jgi:hypothetical protein